MPFGYRKEWFAILDREGKVFLLKKWEKVLLCFVILWGVLLLPACGEKVAFQPETTQVLQATQPAKTPAGVFMGDVLTFEEVATEYGRNAGKSLDEARSIFAAQGGTQESLYRRLSVALDVAQDYRPRLDFYCKIAGNGENWQLDSIDVVELMQESKQFAGNIEVWLRSGNRIEYIINGDFFNNGVPDRVLENDRWGTGEYFGMPFVLSFTGQPSHFQYFYDGKIVDFS